MAYLMRQDPSRIPNLDPQLSILADSVHQLAAAFAERLAIPDIEVELVWAADFVATTQDFLARAHTSDRIPVSEYTAGRLGGQVAGKNISMNEDSSKVAITLNGAMLSTETPESTISSAFLLAHELAHPLLNRLRYASGVLDGVEFPSRTSTEYARSITRGLVDEYWADEFAGSLLKFFGTVEQNGEKTPLNIGHANEGLSGYFEQLLQVLDFHVHPGWPQLVRDYQHKRITLDDLWGQIVTETDQTLTLLAHAQATADGTPEFDTSIREVFKEVRGFNLYINPTWTRIIDSMEMNPIFLQPAEFAAADTKVVDAGEAAIKDMWAMLGLTFEEGPERSLHINVANPSW